MSARRPATADTPAPTDDWSPVRLDLRNPVDRARRALLEREVIGLRIHDTLATQLAELIDCRHPADTMTAAESARLVVAHLAGVAADDYGRWIHYPWSGRLVHVLPEAEFHEVRLARNRNKITLTEQAHLRTLRIGILGLSVGQATAITLAMEGVGGEFVLADFDRLSLSNMNRLRAGVADIDVPKAVLTARQIAEIDPYVRVRIHPDGVHDGNVDAFLAAPRLDLLIEECDDLPMKLRVREHARRLGIPVLMETSDRGMLDVERFDLEPARPLFHGRIGGMQADDLRALDPKARIAAGMTIVGADTISPRLAASAVEVGATLRSWPQLASAVALGAGIVTDTARRIALGEFRASGRYHVDVEAIVRDTVPEVHGSSVTSTAQPAASTDATPPSSAHRLDKRSAGELDAVVSDIVACAIAAPSGGNAQPWRFTWDGATLRCLVDAERATSLLDFEHRATHLACGAAIENTLLAAADHGLRAEVGAFPEGREAPTICAVRLSSATAPCTTDPLHAELFRRHTNRRIGQRVPLPEGAAARLMSAAAERGATLQLIDAPDAMDRLGEILGQGDRLRFLSRPLHRELVSEIRWTTREAESTRDGIDLRTLELGAADHAAFRLAANWNVMDLVAGIGGGRNLEKFAHRAAAGSSAFGVLSIPGDAATAYFEGGRAMQRVWLAASALDLGCQPMAALPYLFMRACAGGTDLPNALTRALVDLFPHYRTVVPLPAGHHELLLFRLAIVDPPSARALRRDVTDVLQCLRHG